MQAIRELHQEVKEHSGYERLEGFICLPTKGEDTFVGLYSNNTNEYDDFVRKIVKKLAKENRKEKTTIEELVSKIEKQENISIMMEYVRTFPTEGGKFARPIKRVYLFITKKVS